MVITSRTRNAVVLFGRVGSNPTLSALRTRLYGGFFICQVKVWVKVFLKVVCDLPIHFFFHIGNSVPINTFHACICTPSSACHDVLVRDSGCTPAAAYHDVLIRNPEANKLSLHEFCNSETMYLHTSMKRADTLQSF